MMKKKKLILLLCILCLSKSVVMAADYEVTQGSEYAFAKPTSITQMTVLDSISKEARNKSKDSFLIPPMFASPTSNLLGSGELLTPNLLTDNQLKDYKVEAYTGVGSVNPLQLETGYGITSAFTYLTDDMYYLEGHIGILEIPSIKVLAKVYEGTTTSSMSKGVAHFTDSSVWNGNVCIAGHNRGTNAYFANIHKLNNGDLITLTTKKGTRNYRVMNVEKISVNDTKNLQNTKDNVITLITCVKNQADYYRWCVQGIETGAVR